ncbi:MAG TPA: PrsW family glutamic-type intramembrane protease [Myxococcus sp.]|nr:PrsW family glutamic-type intramembrane protease [Myxococcus sp.]
MLALGGSAVVPSLLLFWYIYARDKRPEPHGLLLRTFLLGAVICLPVVPSAMYLESLGADLAATGVWGSALVRAFLGAAIPEEVFKFLVLYGYVWRKPAFDEPLDGVVYGATASLGFATLENILYVGQNGFEVAVLRALTAVPGHAFTGVIMGAFVGRAKLAPEGQRFGLLAAGLGWATLLHGAYDTFLMTGTAFAVLAFGVLAIEVQWGRRLYRTLQTEQSVLMGTPALALASAGPGLQLATAGAALMGPSEVEARLPPERPEPPGRSAGSWLKLSTGGLGLSACGIWWLALFASAAEQGFNGAADVIGWGVVCLLSLAPTLLFFWLFRSGLRG